MRHTRLQQLILIGTITLLGTMATHADSDEPGYGKQQNARRGPPPQALEACEALVEGDPCSFTGRYDEELNGTCFSPRDDILACRPEGHKGRGEGRGYGQRGATQDAPE